LTCGVRTRERHGRDVGTRSRRRGGDGRDQGRV
jgi:hypothetical protein